MKDDVSFPTVTSPKLIGTFTVWLVDLQLFSEQVHVDGICYDASILNMHPQNMVMFSDEKKIIC